MHPFCLLLAAVSFSLSSRSDSEARLRLPESVRPLKYEATLDITPGSDSFSGTIEIAVEFDKPTSDLTLHAKEIELQSVSPAPAGIQKGANDLVTLHYAQPFPTSTVRFKINYAGSISRVLTDGAFQQQHAGDWYVFTKFEPITARRVFPCFDEPAFKVPWRLSLRVPKDLKAFSNTAIASEEPADGARKLVRFKETKPLPSYLVAFAVGPFEVVGTGSVGKNHIPSRIVVPKGRASEAEYAASITPRLIEMLEGYFGSPYPYEKLDQVVVPLTTAWGAMENAGMIAYGDFLLSSKAQDSEARRQSTAVTMEHEMSHQWFGDLVTMQWWNDLWLNEAFASWISNKLVAAWRPDWRIQERRAASATIFEADSLSSARRIRQPIEAAGDIGNAFDGITYLKGQAVIGMFEHYVGGQAFARGVRAYLEAHRFGSATSDDLLSALEKAAPGSGVAEGFGSFLNQSGFPRVGVTVDCGSEASVLLTQERLVPRGSTAKENALWAVPVCLSWKAGSQCVLLKGAEERVKLPSQACPDWVFADSGAAGYYTASYSRGDSVKLQLDALNTLNTTEKAALIRNTRVLFASGLGDLEQELRTAAQFSSDSDPSLVRTSADMMESIDELVAADLEPSYSARIQELYGRRAHELGWRPAAQDAPEIRDLRREVVPLVASEGRDGALIEQAQKLAFQWLNDHAAVEAEMVPAILYAAAWEGGRELFDKMTLALRTTKLQRERSWIVVGMAGFRDPALAKEALQLIGAEGIDAREVSRLLFNTNEKTREAVWQFVQANFDKLNAMLPSARGVPFAATLPNSAAGFCDPQHAEEVSAFFTARLGGMPGAARNLAKAIEQIKLCAAQAEVAKPAVGAFLRR